MTESEKRQIVNLVLQALKTNSLSINQLTDVDSLPDDAYIEISGGRKISSFTLMNMFKSCLPGIDVLCSFGNRVDAAVCQDFFTKQVQGRVWDILEVTGLSKLDDIIEPHTYKIKHGKEVYYLIVCITLDGNLVQYRISGDQVYYRARINNVWKPWDLYWKPITDKLDSLSIELNKTIQKQVDELKSDIEQITPIVMSEAEFEKLINPDPERIYYIYEEEEV